MVEQGDPRSAHRGRRGRRRARRERDARPDEALTPEEEAFRAEVEPVYLELVDLLLTRSQAVASEEQALLAEARDTLEALKAAELRDHFRDACLDAQRQTTPEAVPGAVVLYPVVLPDRVELILSTEAGLSRHAAGVDGETLEARARRLRALLTKRTTRQFLPLAGQLYEWLIRPFEADLGGLGVDTLVFVPGGALRTIPMSALHDGEHFLIERYAVAITPGLELTDPRPIDREKLKLLLSGLSESVAGYPALPHVSSELQSIQSMLGGELLLNQDFRRDQMRKSLSETTYTVLLRRRMPDRRGDIAAQMTCHRGSPPLESSRAMKKAA